MLHKRFWKVGVMTGCCSCMFTAQDSGSCARPRWEVGWSRWEVWGTQLTFKGVLHYGHSLCLSLSFQAFSYISSLSASIARHDTFTVIFKFTCFCQLFLWLLFKISSWHD